MYLNLFILIFFYLNILVVLTDSSYALIVEKCSEFLRNIEFFPFPVYFLFFCKKKNLTQRLQRAKSSFFYYFEKINVKFQISVTILSELVNKSINYSKVFIFNWVLLKLSIYINNSFYSV